MTELVSERSPLNLENLSAGTTYQGYVEGYVDGEIVGWCLSATNPIASVELDVYLGAFLIGSTRTSIIQEDLSKALGLPVKAGFRFAVKDADSAALYYALTALVKAGVEDTSLEQFVSVRVKEDGALLLQGSAFRIDRKEFDGLAGLLHQNITAGLQNLDKPPSYRGSVDVFADGAIIGWCVAANNLSSSVELDFYLGEVHVGTAVTSGPRTDLSEILGVPVKAEFRFPLRDCASAALSDAIAVLGKASKDEALLGRLVTVRVRENNCPLPISPEFRLSEKETESIARVLQQRVRELLGNRTVQERNAFLNCASVASTKAQEDVGIVAYYLPQFHPFAENNDWWGEGFTEWTNVSSARPSFTHHYQPRLPADLGYYDLRLDEVQAKQVELAKKYGISAFSYYYYWFTGTTLMTMPIDRHIKNNYDLDFCLCWANENWSRRWDGSENDVLMSQQHTEADDVAFINSVIPYFKHPRYIKINGAPLLIVYRISLLSNPQRVVEQWKDLVRKAGFPDLHISMAETFGLENPHEYGVDSSCQFPPHGITAKERTRDVENLAPGFSGKVYDYVEVAASEIKRPDPAHLRFRTVMPSWDNTSRKGLAGHVFHNATPEVFEAWLSHVVAKTRREHPPGYRYVFINAWNEWAEGAYLEPDRRNGHSYLKAVRNALSVQNAVLGEASLLTGVGKEDEFRRNVMRVVSTLSNANKQLLRFVSEYARPGGPPSPFIARPENAIRRVMMRNDARLQIDAVNGRTAANPEVTVLRQQDLVLNGWLHIRDVTQTYQRPLFIWLTPLEDEEGIEYIASVFHRDQRPDVAAAFGDHENANWYGYRFSGDLREVPSGSYRVGALLASDTDSRAAYAVKADLVIHVG